MSLKNLSAKIKIPKLLKDKLKIKKLIKFIKNLKNHFDLNEEIL